MLRKNVKSLLEQLQVCIFAEIVFGVKCTLKLTGLQKNRDAAANFGCSWNFNRVNGYHGD